MLFGVGCAHLGAHDNVIVFCGSILMSHHMKTASQRPEFSDNTALLVCSFKGIRPERPEKSNLKCGKFVKFRAYFCLKK